MKEKELDKARRSQRITRRTLLQIMPAAPGTP